jgi:hypothetical protein
MSSSRTLLSSLVMAASTIAALPTFAHGIDDGDAIDREFRSQRDRIEQGIRTRALTFGETTRLRSEQNKIATMIARARLDGRIDPYERREIVAAQAIASKHIYAEKHDSEAVAPPRRVGWWHRVGW